jgi:hypothetical protein
MKYIGERDLQLANDANYTLSLLLPAFSTVPRPPADFLPYPPPKQSLDADTAEVIARLSAQGKLNRKVVSILGGLKLLP